MSIKEEWESATVVPASFDGGFGVGSIFAIKLTIDGAPFFIGKSAMQLAEEAFEQFVFALGDKILALSLVEDPDVVSHTVTGNVDLYIKFRADYDWTPSKKPDLASSFVVVTLFIAISLAVASVAVAVTLEPDAVRAIIFTTAVAGATVTGNADAVPQEVKDIAFGEIEKGSLSAALENAERISRNIAFAVVFVAVAYGVGKLAPFIPDNK